MHHVVCFVFASTVYVRNVVSVHVCQQYKSDHGCASVTSAFAICKFYLRLSPQIYHFNPLWSPLSAHTRLVFTCGYVCSYHSMSLCCRLSLKASLWDVSHYLQQIYVLSLWVDCVNYQVPGTVPEASTDDGVPLQLTVESSPDRARLVFTCGYERNYSIMSLYL